MSSTVITPGFTGYAKLTYEATNYFLRFNSCSLNAVQEVEAPDMVMGDYTHNAWAYGKIEVGGQISGPMTEGSMAFLNQVWNSTGGTDTRSTINVKYYNGFLRQFTGMRVNSITFNVNAGEVVQFTADFIGSGWSTTALSDNDMPVHTTPEKLVTWDKAALFRGDQSSSDFTTATNQINDLQSFSITITNNITRQFVIRASDLYGDLVRGMSAVTGSMVSYSLKSAANFVNGDTQTGAGAEHWDAYSGNDYYPIKFSVGGYDVRCTVVFHRATSDLSVGPVLTTIGFTGIGHWGGENDFTPTHNVIALIS